MSTARVLATVRPARRGPFVACCCCPRAGRPACLPPCLPPYPLTARARFWWGARWLEEREGGLRFSSLSVCTSRWLPALLALLHPLSAPSSSRHLPAGQDAHDFPSSCAAQPMEIYVDDEAKLTLHGLKQHYVKLKENEKNAKLFALLDVLDFNQVVIFVKAVNRCVALCKLLCDQNFPAISIHRGLKQPERLERYKQFKDFSSRILVATDLFGRGMDIERVNIVFNYDMPENSDSYLHRVARAGRFGTKGLAISFVTDENDATVLNDVQKRFEVSISELPDEIDSSSYIEEH
eukprot:m.115908 g.115908  ORF g.115908 m.115908 type:complete len:293 (-) comp9489_c1_seq2:168-1046(-)